MRLSQHFRSEEFACKCGCGVGANGAEIAPRLVHILEMMRQKLGTPIVVTSGIRCPKHNKEVGGVSNSQHIAMTAADIFSYTKSPKELAELAEECGADGIGVYDTFVHVDVRGYKARW